MDPIFKEIEHRPWHLPEGSWFMRQEWKDLLFLHWKIPVEKIRKKIPPELEIDTFQNNTYIGIVPFRMSGIRPRFFPSVPYFSAFPELNVRVYVKYKEKPGVFFFSLEATNPFAVEVARLWYHLPYMHANMRVEKRNGIYHYFSKRKDKRGNPAELQITYGPAGDRYYSQKRTLEHWLTERYCLYAKSSKQDLYICEIHHLPWPLQKASCEIKINTMAECHGIQLPPEEPIAHFVKYLDVAIYPIKRLL